MAVRDSAARVVPTLNGVDVHRLTPLWGPFLLLNAGCALRVVAQTLRKPASRSTSRQARIV